MGKADPSDPSGQTPAAALARPLGVHAASLRAGVRFFAVLGAVVVLTTSTGRVAMAWYRRPLSDSLPRWFVAAIWRDLVQTLPYLAALLSPFVLGIVWACAWRRGGQPARRPQPALQALLLFAGLATWISAVSFCESLIQRGTLPVWHDFRGGMDAAFLTSALANFWYARYLVPAVFAWPAVVFCVRVYGRKHNPQAHASNPWGFTLGFVGSWALFAILMHPVHAPRLPLPRVLVSTPGVNDPFGRFLRSLAVALSGAPTQPRDILASVPLPMDRASEGAGLLGLRRQTTPEASCAPHPWGAPLPPHGGEKDSPTTAGLGDISRALWSRPDEALNNIIVFQLSLESLRGDDLAALNPQAPRALAPFLNGLYESARTGHHAVIAAHQMWQGGVRTSQGMSAFACGLGALPHGISLVRDLETVPLRCLSDVLVDAGFQATFAYGSHMAFDNMGPFLAYHGFDAWLTQDTLPKHFPKGEWDAISDRALVKHAVAHFAQTPARPTFTLLMTLSNHSPFSPPQDLDPNVSARVAEALSTHVNVARKEDRPRLTTYSYTDHAVQEFFEQLESTGLAARSIVILHADHATGERFVWPRPDGSDPMTDEAKGRIPFVIVFPDALLARVADPQAFRQAVARTHAAINAAPVSLNDVPLWLLSLLSAHPGVANLPLPWRWHSLGGMTASPAFAPPGTPAPRLWGINGMNQLFFLSAAGRVMGQLEDLMTLTHPDELFTATQPLFGASALLADFLRDYGKRCASPAHIRMRAAAAGKGPQPPARTSQP